MSRLDKIGPICLCRQSCSSRLHTELANALISVYNFIFSSTSLELGVIDWKKYIRNGINDK